MLSIFVMRIGQTRPKTAGVSARARTRPSVLALLLVATALFHAGLAYALDYEKCSVDDEKGTICKIKVLNLRPTQLSVGIREVRKKMEKLHDKSWSKYEDYIEGHPAPVVISPSGEFYIVDHHHLARALANLDMKNMLIEVVANYSDLSEKAFWAKMKKKNWVYLYDENGKGPLDVSALDKVRNVQKLKDDPYRSLAGDVRRAGGYEKSKEPFNEFKWANYFRTRIGIGAGQAGYDSAVERAVALAESLNGKLPRSCALLVH